MSTAMTAMRRSADLLSQGAVPIAEKLLRRDILVIVNSYNQPTYLLRMILNLRENGFKNILIVDQASTSPECVRLLNSKIVRSCCRVIVNAENEGPRHFFESTHYESAPNLFFYTDPDIELPDILPDDFVSRFIAIESRNKIGKVGCALRIDDNDAFDDKKILREGRLLNICDWERQFWEMEIEAGIYLSHVDTTFALYNKLNFDLRHFFRALRVAGAYSARHRPWYKDKRIPRSEWDYYLRQTRHSFWFNLHEVENT